MGESWFGLRLYQMPTQPLLAVEIWVSKLFNASFFFFFKQYILIFKFICKHVIQGNIEKLEKF